MSGTGTVGIVGIGLVGTAIATRLLRAGFAVIGHDIDPARVDALVAAGGIAAGSPRDVASQASRVILSLPTTTVVRDVLTGPDGILAADPLPGLVIDTTTGDPVDTAALHGELWRRGVACLDAPVSGSSQDVLAGTGTYLTGGDETVVASCSDIFDALGRRRVHAGPAGAGMRAKLAVNLVLGLNRAVLAEGIVFAESIGIEPRVAVELFSATAAASRVLDMKGERMASGFFDDPAARLRQHRKDVALILDLGRHHGVHLPFSDLHKHVLDKAIEAGDGDLDNSAVLKQVRREARGGPDRG